jgi:arginine exporter protein ArgO
MNLRARNDGDAEDSTATDVPWLLVGLLVAHAVFGIGLLLSVGPAWPLALLWSGACAISGNLIGFLFGVPRTSNDDHEVRRDTVVQSRSLDGTDGSTETNTEAHTRQVQHPAYAPADADEYHLSVNTNLEQVSDWLTKILVGVGLTQIHSLPSQLMRAAVFIANGFGGTQFQLGLALALLIYFPVLGFLSGYLCTRLFLQPAFRRWDRSFTKRRRRK